MRGFTGSMRTSAAPVSSSRYSTRSNVRPPSSERKIPRSVDAVPSSQIGTLLGFSRAYVDDVGVRRRNRQRSDRASRLVVENRRPGTAGVGGLPDAAIDDSDVKRVGTAWHTVERLGTTGPMRSDVAPAELGEHAAVERRGALRGNTLDGIDDAAPSRCDSHAQREPDQYAAMAHGRSVAELR
jgi:hypothetical protein